MPVEVEGSYPEAILAHNLDPHYGPTDDIPTDEAHRVGPATGAAGHRENTTARRGPETGSRPGSWTLPDMGDGADRDLDMVTVADAARMMRVSIMTVYRLIEAGELPAVRIRRSLRIPRRDFDGYLRDAHTQPPPRTETEHGHG